MADDRPPRFFRPPRPPAQPARTSGGGGGQAPRTSGASQRAHTLKQKFIAAFTERLPFKATALFFALILWLIVSAEEPTSGQVPVRLMPTVDTSLQLLGQIPEITAYVVGTRSDLLRLTTNSPTIHLSVPANAPDTLRVRLDTLDLTMPSGVNVSVRQLQPEVVTMRFGSEVRRRLPVRSQLRFSADSGFVIAGPPSFSPETVQVVGPRRRVQVLDGVPTIASDLVVSDTQPVTVPLDTSGLGARVTPAEVQVRIPIEPDTAMADTLSAAG